MAAMAMSLLMTFFMISTQLGSAVHHKPASNEHQIQHNRIRKSHNNDATISADERHSQRPYFDTNDAFASSNITLMLGESAYLVCVVRNVGNNSISWIRHNDINLLSVGKFKYTQDPRYQIFHNSYNDTWTLKIRRVRVEDSGLYECQIGLSESQPIGRMIYLKVIEPELSILQGNEMFTEVASNLNLTCFIKRTRDESLPFLDDELRGNLKWLHNNQEINHHSPRGIFLSTTRQDGAAVSHLIVENLTHSDAGVYTCYMSIESHASIVVHVLGSSDRAMETRVSSIAHELQSRLTFTNMLLPAVMMITLLRLSY